MSRRVKAIEDGLKPTIFAAELLKSDKKQAQLTNKLRTRLEAMDYLCKRVGEPETLKKSKNQ